MRWGRYLLLSAVLLLAALSSVWAWPSAGSVGKESSATPPAVQQDIAAEAETDTSGQSTGLASTEPQMPSEAPSQEMELIAMLEKDPDALRASLRESLGDRAYARAEPYIDIMIAEYEEACDRHDALAEEYNALASDHTKMINDSFDRDVDFLIAPEAVYDITDNTWGAGLSIAASWKNLAFTAGAEKMFGEGIGWDEGYRVRLGVGILL